LPNLNPTKQVWFYIKAWVIEKYPELENVLRVLEEDIEKLEKALIKAWDALPSLFFKSLIDSMEQRVNAC
jgi:cell wall assembly regulator SMI1